MTERAFVEKARVTRERTNRAGQVLPGVSEDLEDGIYEVQWSPLHRVVNLNEGIPDDDESVAIVVDGGMVLSSVRRVAPSPALILEVLVPVDSTLGVWHTERWTLEATS